MFGYQRKGSSKTPSTFPVYTLKSLLIYVNFMFTNGPSLSNSDKNGTRIWSKKWTPDTLFNSLDTSKDFKVINLFFFSCVSS